MRLFVMTVRYVSVIRMEAARLRTAMKARAFKPSTNRHTYTSYGNLIGMLLVRSLDRATQGGKMPCSVEAIMAATPMPN